MSTPGNILTPRQGQLLIQLARQALNRELGGGQATSDGWLSELKADPDLQKLSGVFVTLKIQDRLRGCIGSLTGYESIWQGVRTHAVNAGFHDPRFPALTADELENVRIEVSVLTAPQPLAYTDGSDLIASLHPHEDGVIVRKGQASATFLPQVWEQLPDPVAFLSSLCTKAGLPADIWRHTPLTVETYRVQSFEEE